jgi:hypothetical protein
VVTSPNACSPAPLVYPSTVQGKAVPFCPFRIPSGVGGHYIVNFEATKTTHESVVEFYRLPRDTVCGVSPTWSYGYFKDAAGKCRRHTERMSYRLTTPIPAGTYDVYMFAWDDHCDATGHCDYVGSANAQDNETIKLRLCDSTGICTHGENYANVVGTTSQTLDIPKNVNYTTPLEVGSDMVIPRSIAQITPIHGHPQFDEPSDNLVNNCLRADGTLYRCSPYNSVVPACALLIRKTGTNSCTSATTNITCTGCATGGTCNAQCVQPTAGTTNVNCTGCATGGTCNAQCVQPTTITNRNCVGCATGGTCNAQCQRPATTTTNVVCTNCPTGSCDILCNPPVATQSTVTINCSTCGGGGSCPVACVVPPIVSTTSRPIDVEEF